MVFSYRVAVGVIALVRLRLVLYSLAAERFVWA